MYSLTRHGLDASESPRPKEALETGTLKGPFLLPSHLLQVFGSRLHLLIESVSLFNLFKNDLTLFFSTFFCLTLFFSTFLCLP